jgi:hypothetical protein
MRGAKIFAQLERSQEAIEKSRAHQLTLRVGLKDHAEASVIP